MGSQYKTFKQNGSQDHSVQTVSNRSRELVQHIYPVHSTAISADLGEDAPSLWGVLVDGDDDKVEVSLYRLDSLAVGANITITLEISHQEVEYKVTDKIETGEDDLERM